MGYQGDRVKKEKEALDLIIKMKKKDEGSHSGELLFFVVIPLLMAVIVIQFKPILEFARNSKEISAAVKMVYPEWKSAEDLAPPPIPLPGEQPGVADSPVPGPPTDTPRNPDGPLAPPSVPVSPGESSTGPATFSPTTSGATLQTAPAGEDPAFKRGHLLH